MNFIYRYVLENRKHEEAGDAVSYSKHANAASIFILFFVDFIFTFSFGIVSDAKNNLAI